MNFYKHHIGDYAAATAHLSFVEDAAYSRLLRIYYRDERPLPVDPKVVQRLAGARSREEKVAVETVLREFFVVADDGWHSKRADEEIARASAQADTNRRIAEEREARKRDRERQRMEHESCNESLAVREPSQTPDTRLQDFSPDSHSHTAPAAPAIAGGFEGHSEHRATPNPAAAYCIALQPMQVRVTSLNPDLLAAIAEGVTAEHLVEVARLNPGKPIKYLTTQARRELAERASAITPGGPNGSHRKLSAGEQVRAAVAGRGHADAGFAEAGVAGRDRRAVDCDG